jgi:hypothetical protein
MTKTFAIDTFDGHIILLDNNQKILLDTGCPATIGRQNTLEFMGRQHQCKTSVAGIGIDNISRLMNYNVDALMGMDLIKQYYLKIEYNNKSVTFSEDEIPFSPICSTPIINEMGAISIALSVKGDNVRLALDTGAKISYIGKTFTQNEAATDTKSDFNPMIGNFETPIYNLNASIEGIVFPVKFGNLPGMYAMQMKMMGLDGAIGYDLFIAHNVYLDFHKWTMHIG